MQMIKIEVIQCFCIHKDEHSGIPAAVTQHFQGSHLDKQQWASVFTNSINVSLKALGNGTMRSLFPFLSKIILIL